MTAIADKWKAYQTEKLKMEAETAAEKLKKA